MLQIRRSFPPKLSHDHVVVDDDTGRRVRSEHDPVGDLLDLRIEIATPRCGRHARRLQSLHLPESPVRYVQIEFRTAGEYFLRINFRAPINEFKHIAEHPDRFRRSEHQVATWIQRVVKEGKSAFLQLCPEIDENIATTNQIEP